MDTSDDRYPSTRLLCADSDDALAFLLCKRPSLAGIRIGHQTRDSPYHQQVPEVFPQSLLIYFPLLVEGSHRRR